MTPELAIRSARAAFNRALSEGDIAAIGPLLTANAILVTGTDSVMIAGRRAQLETWKRMFAAADRIVYERLSEAIIVSPVAPIAFEHGRWQGATRDGRIEASGTYSAKWRAAGGVWQIEAELYLTLA